MKSLLLSASLAVFSLPAQVPLSEWFPVHTGDKWVYEHETRDDDGQGKGTFRVDRWTTEETTVAATTIPEGTLVVKEVRVIDAPPRFSPYRPQPGYLIRDKCLYILHARDLDVSQTKLAAEYKQFLLNGQVAADFCFPLTIGKTWGAPHWSEWRPPADAKDWRVAGVTQNTFHITSVSSYLGSGMTGERWFEKGVGLVRELDVHHGTFGEYRTRLLKFEPLRKGPAA